MKNQGRTRLHQQAGSALILVFVMIGLFAALSFAYVQSSRTGASQLTNQQARLAATEIIQLGQNMKQVVQTLRINGCKDTEISFEGEPTTGFNYTNPQSPGVECEVFDFNGGALQWNKSSIDEGIWMIIGIHCYEGIGSTAACSPDTTELELNLIDIPDSVCIEINRVAGIGVPGAAPPQENYNATTTSILFYFSGIYNGTNNVNGNLQGIGASGKHYGCYKDNVGALLGKNIFYYILIAR